jgi:hypothetical protein
MANWLIKRAAAKKVEGAVHQQVRKSGLLNIRYGLSLLLNRNVPVLRKALAIGLGVVAASLLVALELPFESIVAGLLNLFGMGLDVLLDGLEVIVGPILFAAMIMPRLYRLPDVGASAEV